jgi:hypothetical protein
MTDRLRRIVKEVCADLGCKPDDEIARHVSTLRLMRENMQAKLVVGEHVNPSDLLAVDSALKAYLPQGKPATIEVKIATGLHATCPRCGYNTPVDSEKLRGAVKVESPHHDSNPAPDAASGRLNGLASPSTDEPAPAPAPPPVPVSVQREGISASKFHSQLLNGHEVAPIKRPTGRLVSPLSVKGY